MVNAPTMNELDVARSIADGRLTSPQRCENVWLFAIRITGTGYAYRPKHDEIVFRPPDKYLNDEFLARCSGLPVIYKHPAQALLDSKEFAERTVGSIFVPYIADDEVWGIAKIYDEAAAKKMAAGELSTSPAVFFRDPNANQKLTLENGAKLLVESNPSLIDHVALCERGVWDKGGEPSGVRADSTRDNEMTEEEKKKADEEAEAKKKTDADVHKKLDMICDALGGLGKRMDAIEEGEKARTDKAKKDAEEEERRKNGDPERLAADAARALADAADAKKRIDEVAAMVKPLPDDDHRELADEWNRADEAFSSLGRETPRPIPGETAALFRRRTTRALQEFSPRWKNADLSREKFPDDSSFKEVAAQVRADAFEFGKSPASVPQGNLRMITRTINGHTHNTFVGDPNAWMAQFAGPKFKVAHGRFRYQFSRDGEVVSA